MQWRRSSAAPTNQSSFWRHSEVERRRAESLVAIKAAADKGNGPVLSAQIDRALYLDDLLAAVAPYAARPGLAAPDPKGKDIEPSHNDVTVYVVGSMFLSECLISLLQTSRQGTQQEEAESIALISGARVGAFRAWDRLVQAPISYRSKVGAVIDGDALSTSLRLLDKFGYALYGVIHLHLHNGPPKPSSTDLALSKKLEDGGYPLIQAVFSESGHVRFFSHQRVFEVMTYGIGIEKLDHRLFRVSPPAEVTNR